MRILITGADGQLGRALQMQLTDPPYHIANSWKTGGKNNQIALFAHRDRRWRQNFARALDVTDAIAVRAAISSEKPEVVIHCAAWTDTAGCERDPDRALLDNAGGARNVAEACREAGAAMLYVCTNEVFDGEKGAAYDEDDPPNPINAYGRSKLAGEEAVRQTTPDHYIVRTSWLYGPGRTSFPEKILRAAREQGKLRLVSDEIASPTWTLDLAGAIARLIHTGRHDVYHLANGGECSRKEWAEEVLRLAGIDVPTEASTQAEFGAPYRKPVRSTLANNRAAALGIILRSWPEALSEHIRQANEPTVRARRAAG